MRSLALLAVLAATTFVLVAGVAVAAPTRDRGDGPRGDGGSSDGGLFEFPKLVDDHGLRIEAPNLSCEFIVVFRRASLALTHMWNGPGGKAFFTDFPQVGRCGHMSGL